MTTTDFADIADAIRQAGEEKRQHESKMYDIVDCVKNLYGFDPRHNYCSVTGKPIGESWEVMDFVASMTGDVETCADDLAMRVLANMKPSIRWNRMRIETLEEMRKSDPRETLAYLINALLIPHKDDRNALDLIGQQNDRIRLWKIFSAADIDESFQTILGMLLEIDGCLGLKIERSPITAGAILDSEAPMAFLLAKLSPWYAARVAFFVKSEAEAKFFLANPGARKAFFQHWKEQAPPTLAKVKQNEKTATENYMAAILAELSNPVAVQTKPMAQRAHVQERSTPVYIAPRSTKMPARFGKKG